MALGTVQTIIREALIAGTLGRLGARGRPIRQGRIGLNVKSNIEGASVDIERLVRDHNWVQAAALNKTARQAATQVRRELAQVKGVPQKILKNRVQPYKAFPKKKPIRSAVWIGTKKPITAAEFKGTVTTSRTGYVKVGRRIFKGAFSARMPTGHKGIFTRKPHARHKRRPDGQMTQLPIEEAIVQLLPEARVIGRRITAHHFKTTFPAEVKRLMTRRVQRRRF